MLFLLLCMGLFRAVDCEQYCLKCDGVRRMEDCTRVWCSQKCYTEEIVTRTEILYNAGCRGAEMCSLPSTMGKRTINYHVVCVGCCPRSINDTSVDCNARLCGLPGSSTHSGYQAATRCYKCDVWSSNFRDCSNIVTCQQDEMCGAERAWHTTGMRGAWYYALDCFPKKVCLNETIYNMHEGQRTSFIGKRYIANVQKVCCGDSFCNDANYDDLVGFWWISMGLLWISHYISGAEYCLKCDMVKRVGDCSSNIKCAADEYCYTDEIITATGIRYNAGCRAARACVKPSVGKRSTDTLVACARCCNGTYRNVTNCNSKLCGFLSTQTQGTQGLPKCYSCDKVHNLDDCNQIVTCSQDQICGTETHVVTTGGHSINGTSGDHTYSLGCSRKDLCTRATQIVLEFFEHQAQTGAIGRRGSGVNRVGCNICCGGDFCNTGDCVEVAKKLYELKKIGHLNMTTLTYSP